jgi:hypothetical protein
MKEFYSKLHHTDPDEDTIKRIDEILPKYS